MPVLDQFKIAQDAGFDGISLFAPDRFDLKESLIALDKTGVRIHNVNNAVHWKVRLSDADAGVQKQAVQALKDTIQFAHDCGADSMLCVNGKVTDEKRENHEQVRTRSLAPRYLWLHVWEYGSCAKTWATVSVRMRVNGLTTSTNLTRPSSGRSSTSEIITATKARRTGSEHLESGW